MSDRARRVGQVAWDAVHNHGAFRRDFPDDDYLTAVGVAVLRAIEGCTACAAVKGEPTDTKVRAVWDALGPGVTIALEYEELRAALRAAAATQGENR